MAKRTAEIPQPKESTSIPEARAQVRVKAARLAVMCPNPDRPINFNDPTLRTVSNDAFDLSICEWSGRVRIRSRIEPYRVVTCTAEWVEEESGT